MADFGRELISKIITDRDIVPIVTSGITPEWFEDEEHRSVYTWVVEYYNRYGKSPTQKALKTEYPSYRVISVEEPYEYYIDQFRQQRRRAILMDTIISADLAIKDGDTRTAEGSLSKGLIRLGREISSLKDENITSTVNDRYATYVEARNNSGKLTGISTGFKTLDEVSGGFHPQQFVVLGGQAKQCKSFMLLKSAMGAQELGHKVLFLSFEMSVFEQLARYDAMYCGVNSARILHGTMTVKDMKKLRVGMREVRNLASFIMSADISASTTVSGLAGKIEQHQPDIIFIDGVYLMENEIGAEQGSSQAYTSISRGLKRLAQRIGKPIVVSTQALSSKMKDNVVTMHSLGWTSAWSQDADLILGVERLGAAPMLKLRVVGGRNVSPREIGIDCDWETSSFTETSPDDYDDEDD